MAQPGAKTLQPQATERRPEWLERAGVGLLQALVALARALPEGLVYRLADWAGRAIYLWLGPDFLGVRQHLRIAFRGASAEELRERARAFWRHFARTLAESARLAQWTREDAGRRLDLPDLPEM